MSDNNQSTQSGNKPRSKRAQTAAISQAAKATAAKAIKNAVHEECKPRPGQPTKFTRELWERILEAVATYQDLIEICGQDDMPAVATIYRWMKADPQLKDEMRAAWEMFSMIGHSVNRNILRGGRLSSGDVRRDIELASDNRWHMGKTNRRDFGDKTLVQVETVEPIVLESWMMPGSKILPSGVPAVQEGLLSRTPIDAQDDTLEGDPHS